jgi:hypothetical protein
VQTALERDEKVNNLLLGGSIGVARSRSPRHASQIAETVGDLCRMGSMTPPFPLILAEARDSTGSLGFIALRNKDLNLPVSWVVASP